jgi:hypothetical protein
MMRPLQLLLLVLGLSLAGCGSAVQTCSSSCDCEQRRSDQSTTCAGEWVCREGTCQYACKSDCTGAVFTCRSGESCNGAICSERTACN